MCYWSWRMINSFQNNLRCWTLWHIRIKKKGNEKLFKLTSLSFWSRWLSFCCSFFCREAICSRNVMTTTWSLSLLGTIPLFPVFDIFSGTSDKFALVRSGLCELLLPRLDGPEFPILWDELVFSEASSAVRFLCLCLSLSDFLAFANARL